MALDVPIETPPARPRVAARGSLGARVQGDRSVLARAQATSPLCFLRPTFPGSRSAAVCLVTFGGGLVDGDAIEVDISVEAGATLVVFTQSTTKAFRGASRQTIRAEVHGTLVLLPDPVACFRGARFRQRVDVTLHGEGSAVVLDGFTSGRAAFGDRWAFDGIHLATTIRRDGRLLVREALRLDRDDAPIDTRMDRFEAFATVLAIGPRVLPVSNGLLAPSIVAPDVVAAPSSLSGSSTQGAIVRIAGTSPTRTLEEARARLRNLPDIDVVDPFASRY